MNNGILKELKKCGREIHYLQNGGKGILIQSQMNKGTTLQSLGENMGRKIEFIDLLFEGNTSDWMEEDNKKKSKKKRKKKRKKNERRK